MLADLEAAGAWLDEHSPPGDGVGVLWKCHPDHADLLARDIALVMPFIEDIREIVARAETRELLSGWDHVGARPPNLARTRNQVNVLCGAAVLAARNGDPLLALRRLCDARAIGLLLQDGSEFGGLIGQAMDNLVLQAIITIAYDQDPGPCPHVDHGSESLDRKPDR